MDSNLVIQNGTVIDPASGTHGKYDVAIVNGKIRGIYACGTVDNVTKGMTIDATGCLVTPGLIDIHTHVFYGETELGIEADRVGVNQGVTTLVDAGSAGYRTFGKFITDVVKQSTTQVLAWINIAGDGLCAGRAELTDAEKLETARTVELISQNPCIRGIKVRMSSSVLGSSGLKPLEIAKQAASVANVPLMVHIGNGPPYLGDILDLLDRGDVVTHAFHGKQGGIFTADRELIPQAQKALTRGVLFDVGHGTSSFSFQTMVWAKAAGVKPYTISTDIYVENYHGPVYSLVKTLSKFLALGYSLEEVVTAVTTAPAKLLNLTNSLGNLVVGQTADISILRLTEGEFDFFDSDKNHLLGRQLLQPKYTIRAGKVLTCK